MKNESYCSYQTPYTHATPTPNIYICLYKQNVFTGSRLFFFTTKQLKSNTTKTKTVEKRTRETSSKAPETNAQEITSQIK